MEAYLTTKIRSLKERLQTLDCERITVAAELGAYQDALHHLTNGKSSVGAEKETEQRSRPSPTAFEMSKDWLNVMRELCKRDRPFGAGDMVKTAAKSGFDTKTSNARSQLAFYKKKNYVDRAERGRYIITAKGKAVFQRNDAPAG